jgi:hypothetical protein
MNFGGITLAQDKYKWQALVNAVINVRFPWNVVNFLTNWEPIRNIAGGIELCSKTLNS